MWGGSCVLGSWVLGFGIWELAELGHIAPCCNRRRDLHRPHALMSRGKEKMEAAAEGPRPHNVWHVRHSWRVPSLPAAACAVGPGLLHLRLFLRLGSGFMDSAAN